MAHKKNRTEQEQRDQLGGYTEDEFDREFIRSHRSDWISVAVRVLTLLVVYGFVARAILKQELTLWMLILPLVFEMLLVFWFGWFLSRFVIDCKAFRKSAGNFFLVLFWTVALAAGMGSMLVFNPGGTQPESATVALQAGWQTVRSSGLLFALAAVALSLLFSTGQEVMRWQAKRGVFVWTSIMTAGFRIGVGIVLGMLLVVLTAITGGTLYHWMFEWFDDRTVQALTWLVYSHLLLLELATVVVVTLMHRDIGSKRSATAAKTRLP